MIEIKHSLTQKQASYNIIVTQTPGTQEDGYEVLIQNFADIVFLTIKEDIFSVFYNDSHPTSKPKCLRN